MYTRTHTHQYFRLIHKETHGEHLLAIQNWKTGKETPQYKTDCKRCNWGVTHGGRNKNSETIERTPAGRNGQRLTTTRLSSYTSTEVLLSSQKGISGARKVRWEGLSASRGPVRASRRRRDLSEVKVCLESFPTMFPLRCEARQQLATNRH